MKYISKLILIPLIVSLSMFNLSEAQERISDSEAKGRMLEEYITFNSILFLERKCNFLSKEEFKEFYWNVRNIQLGIRSLHPNPVFYSSTLMATSSSTDEHFGSCKENARSLIKGTFDMTKYKVKFFTKSGFNGNESYTDALIMQLHRVIFLKKLGQLICKVDNSKLKKESQLKALEMDAGIESMINRIKITLKARNPEGIRRLDESFSAWDKNKDVDLECTRTNVSVDLNSIRSLKVLNEDLQLLK